MIIIVGVRIPFISSIAPIDIHHISVLSFIFIPATLPLYIQLRQISFLFSPFLSHLYVLHTSSQYIYKYISFLYTQYFPHIFIISIIHHFSEISPYNIAFSPSYLFFIYPLSHKHHLSVISPSLITILYVKSPQRSTISQPYSRHISAVSLSS